MLLIISILSMKSIYSQTIETNTKCAVHSANWSIKDSLTAFTKVIVIDSTLNHKLVRYYSLGAENYGWVENKYLNVIPTLKTNSVTKSPIENRLEELESMSDFMIDPMKLDPPRTTPKDRMQLLNPITGQPLNGFSDEIDEYPPDLELMKKLDALRLDTDPLRSIREASPVPFKPAELNFDRFNNSPAKNELGYTPNEVGTYGYNEQLDRYRRYETLYYSKKVGVVVLVLVFVLLLYFKGGFLLSLASYTSKNLNSLKEHVESPDLIDISAAMSKLDQIKKAHEAGLIDSATFQEMKSKIKERMKKEI